MFVKPAEGRAPRDPRTGLRVLAEGQHVNPLDMDWQQLLRFGDVEEADAPPEPEPAPAPDAPPADQDEEHR